MRKLPKREGFTLIELLIVVIIIGVLATIAISLFWRAKDRGIQATLQTDLKAAALHQEHYFEKHRTYAATLADLPDFTASPGVLLTITHAAVDGWAGRTTHHSLTAAACGLLVGAAPAGSADPATTPGIVQCTGE